MHRHRVLLLAASLLTLSSLGMPGCRLTERVTDPELSPSLRTATPTHNDRSRRSRTIYGESERVGRGTVRSFVELSGRRPIAIGVEFTKRALRGLPASGPEQDYVLELPRRAFEPFTHVYLNYNPEGHSPLEIYGIPHFDIHFYMISNAEREAIDGSRGGQNPASQFVPAGYISTVDVVPRMGVHWIDPRSPEFQPGGRFTRTLIYGFFDGRMAFIEPMITLDFLRNGRSVRLRIPQPAEVQQTGYYPQRYVITRSGDDDDDGGERVIVKLTDFVFRRAAGSVASGRD